MTTLELKQLLDSIQPDLERVKNCADDSELDEHHAVSDHYDCVTDLRAVAHKILSAVLPHGYLELSDEGHSTLTLLRNATWLDDDLDIEKACQEVALYLSEEQ